jgi:hypothetical protein
MRGVRAALVGGLAATGAERSAATDARVKVFTRE